MAPAEHLTGASPVPTGLLPYCLQVLTSPLPLVPHLTKLKLLSLKYLMLKDMSELEGLVNLTTATLTVPHVGRPLVRHTRHAIARHSRRATVRHSSTWRAISQAKQLGY